MVQAGRSVFVDDPLVSAGPAGTVLDLPTVIDALVAWPAAAMVSSRGYSRADL